MKTKTIDHRDKSAVLSWDTEYEGAAIYALVDDEGKMYIGQAQCLQKRLYAHLQALKRAANDGRKGGCRGEGRRLSEAVANGKKFVVKILRTFPEEYITLNVLRYWEGHYYRHFGKVANRWEVSDLLYNSTTPPPPVWNWDKLNVPIKTVT